MEKKYFSYIRVSTVKQGERGVSLQEQQDTIMHYAQKQGLHIVRTFEGKETAAKKGRPVFAQMMRLLKRGEACGVIMHKIDRGARNLKDWADLAELIDAGIEVHFANESLDMNTRGGRLSADIQAVVAADYIRNLREETKKGFYGRLKQGLYPIGAPIGYQDRGGGQVKTLDIAMAPLVREAFQRYATGGMSLPRLVDQMASRGLRNRRGGTVSLNGMSTILRNPFYIGMIRIRKTGECFSGVHEPLVDKRTFEIVQAILDGKTVPRTNRHEFAFSRMIRCSHCGCTIMAELQKGRIYYRCHTKDCLTKTLREDRIERSLAQAFRELRLNDEEIAYARQWFVERRSNRETEVRKTIETCNLQLAQISERLNRLTDAYLDGAIDKAILEERRAELLFARAGVQQKLHDAEAGNDPAAEQLERYLELVKGAQNLHKLMTPAEKRNLVKELTSNLSAQAESVVITLNSGAQIIANRQKVLSGRPNRGVPRTWKKILEQLLEKFENENPKPELPMAA